MQLFCGINGIDVSSLHLSSVFLCRSPVSTLSSAASTKPELESKPSLLIHNR